MRPTVACLAVTYEARPATACQTFRGVGFEGEGRGRPRLPCKELRFDAQGFGVEFKGLGLGVLGFRPHV